MSTVRRGREVRLPPELLLLIFRQLSSPVYLANCSSVCRSWSYAASEQGLWLKWCKLYWIPLPAPAIRENIKEKDKERFAKWPAMPSDIQSSAKKAFVDW